MYEHVFHFFGLRENPFHVSPDPRFFCSTRAHASALENLRMGVGTRQGLIMLTGEAGTGKTILLHHFLNWLQSRQQTSCYIFQSQLKALELLHSILQDFGVACDSRRRSDLLAALRKWLVQRHELGDSPVLVIDEAQSIPIRTLDRLRMLLNLETPEGKLLQIVLSGHTGLEEKLRRPELRQMHQRIASRCSLRALSMKETAEYVKARLVTSGAKDAALFPEESLEAIHFYAEGIPRVVNLLCEHAMLRAFAEKQNVITQDNISRVAATFELAPQPAPQGRPPGLTHFGRSRSQCSNEGFARPTREVIESTNDKMKANNAPFRAADLEQSEPELKRKFEPSQGKTEGAVLIAAAAVGRTRATTPQPRKAQSPIVALVVQEQPEEVGPELAPPKELPVRGKRARLSESLFNYWQSVQQSFVRDFKQLTKKIPGPSSQRA
jgi:general secretion pathway protein A